MDSFNACHKVSCWSSIGEFEEVIKLIFDEHSTPADKRKALSILQAWKVRRAQDTPLGVLCTIALLDVLVRDLENQIADSSVINSLYQNSLMKFINFASCFDLNTSTMYRMARKLQLDSFLIDLRHSIAHGRQSFNLEVLRNSHGICLKWIKDFYWDKKLATIADVDIKDLRFDAVLEDKLDSILPFFDLLAELTHRNIKTFEQLDDGEKVIKARWPTVKKYMDEKRLTTFPQAFKHFKSLLMGTIASKSVRLNSKTFFHALLTKCDYFMDAFENSSLTSIIDEEEEDDDDDEAQILTPAKRAKLSNRRRSRSIVNLYQDIIWQIAKYDYLKLFLEMLLQIYCNQGEKQSRRQSAHFWIMITLKSYQYYQQFCEFTKSNAIDQTAITQETRNIYSYQLNADLKNVIIFVGSQILPSYMKYSREFLAHLMENLYGSESDCDMCMNLMPLVYPPLSAEQVEDMKKLIGIKTSTRRSGKAAGGGGEGEEMKVDVVHTIEDLQQSKREMCDKKVIWKREDTTIHWSSLPIGYEFRV